LPLGFFYFLLDQKVTKNQVNKHLLLPHTPLPGNQPKPRLRYFALLAFAHARASAKFANAFSTTQATLFWLISPEAGLLTGFI